MKSIKYLALIALFAIGAAGCSSSEEESSSSSSSGEMPDELCDAEWEKDREGCN